ncbi:Fur family transcriptional regulator [Delftia sp. PS-11]|uniref:Fur family transcriptional regulator n=1 Tax=Delftia sp. PS-11 TaxID=2767222 RepID=UPI00245475ED|nr:Fur family transcriptional regulator [Delftia sp. PS-11]
MQLTTNQQRVLTALRQASEPLGAYALLDRLREHGFSAPMQVYRALERLANDGLVHRLATLNAYVPCNHAVDCQYGLRAFAICDQCGHVDEFSGRDLGRSIGRWTKSKSFALRSSTIELHGKCAACAGPQ